RVGRRARRIRQPEGTGWHGQPAGRRVPPHYLHAAWTKEHPDHPGLRLPHRRQDGRRAPPYSTAFRLIETHDCQQEEGASSDMCHESRGRCCPFSRGSVA
ncbi:unnamed protein product, partial [Ectocarpus sp. 12 AP-2014]